MKYEVQNYEHLLSGGIVSDDAMRLHFTLYAGYVKNVNLLLEKLSNTEAGTPEYAELHRRYGWEWNGMRLHEIFFGSLNKDATTFNDGSELGKKIISKWENFENFKKEFLNVASIRGMGWTILFEDNKAGNLFISWVNEHDVGHLSDCKILSLVDMFEHAYMLDHKTDRATYVNNVLGHVNSWV